ncbi:hypothetical protein D3C77_450670 [compost metagenome]
MIHREQQFFLSGERNKPVRLFRAVREWLLHDNMLACFQCPSGIIVVRHIRTGYYYDVNILILQQSFHITVYFCIRIALMNFMRLGRYNCRQLQAFRPSNEWSLKYGTR